MEAILGRRGALYRDCRFLGAKRRYAADELADDRLSSEAEEILEAGRASATPLLSGGRALGPRGRPDLWRRDNPSGLPGRRQLCRRPPTTTARAWLGAGAGARPRAPASLPLAYSRAAPEYAGTGPVLLLAKSMAERGGAGQGHEGSLSTKREPRRWVRILGRRVPLWAGGLPEQHSGQCTPSVGQYDC
jgi:hypothetical protein